MPQMKTILVYEIQPELSNLDETPWGYAFVVSDELIRFSGM